MGDADVAAVAALLADRTRAGFCSALLDGRFHTAGELARGAGVSASTASEHLARLVEGGLLEVDRQGRHRYFRIADPRVAHLVETLAVLAPSRPVTSLRQARVSRTLREGRTCYDHLAGELGVRLTERLVAATVLTADLAVADLSRLEPLGLRLPDRRRGPLSRPCVDWTHRTYHVAGALATALTRRLFELEWLARLSTTRAVRLTAEGEQALAVLLPEPDDRAVANPEAVG